MNLESILRSLFEPKVIKIMIFYAVITFFIGPILGGVLMGRKGMGHGYLVGGIVSLLLWHFYGRRIARM